MTNMVAVKRVKYPHGSSGREYAPGEPFTALSERDAKGLYFAGKATYAGPSTEKRTTSVDLPEAAHQAKEDVSEPAPLSGSYLRRDMRAENGQTGEAKPSPSSRRGRPPKQPISDASGDDAE